MLIFVILFLWLSGSHWNIFRPLYHSNLSIKRIKRDLGGFQFCYTRFTRFSIFLYKTYELFLVIISLDLNFFHFSVTRLTSFFFLHTSVLGIVCSYLVITTSKNQSKRFSFNQPETNLFLPYILKFLL